MQILATTSACVLQLTVSAISEQNFSVTNYRVIGFVQPSAFSVTVFET